MLDEVVYYSSLFICISLASYYKKIENADMKRNYGVGLGILVACLICGQHIYHTVLMVWGNVVIIKCCDKRYVHQISMVYTWTYLLYLHFNLSCSVYVKWLHQTLALRLVGLAFEMSSLEKTGASRSMSSIRLPMGDSDIPLVEPTAVDIIAYTYFFIGLHKGPYYRWKIFYDHFKAPFGVLGDCRIITEQKLKKALNYYEDDFYNIHGSDYRFLYNMPLLVMFFLYSQMIMMLCTSVYTEAGFGVYPAKCEPVPGYGPSKRPSLLKMVASTPDVALEQEYNFAMLKCFQNEKLLMGPKMRDTINGWDMPSRYWFRANIYNNLIHACKEVRSAGSFFAWAVWQGPSLQQMIVSSTLWVYIHLEAEYSTLYNTTGQMKMPWNIGFTIMRMFCLIYLTPCMAIADASTILRYYHSIFWIFHFILLIFIVGAVVAYKSKR
ncbi:lysophospholipid acyltransferase 7-like isoform X2 [Ostrinia nubilalis]|uniref:lysophospholipid acyltransferase 7-like isoform X2 n=1 Tax=Ostrinia nubilalis TaxID=29057 RepID=UPI0030825FF2